MFAALSKEPGGPSSAATHPGLKHGRTFHGGALYTNLYQPPVFITLLTLLTDFTFSFVCALSQGPFRALLSSSPLGAFFPALPEFTATSNTIMTRNTLPFKCIFILLLTKNLEN
jgi:hypothetical protein